MGKATRKNMDGRLSNGLIRGAEKVARGEWETLNCRNGATERRQSRNKKWVAFHLRRGQECLNVGQNFIERILNILDPSSRAHAGVNYGSTRRREKKNVGETFLRNGQSQSACLGRRAGGRGLIAQIRDRLGGEQVRDLRSEGLLE